MIGGSKLSVLERGTLRYVLVMVSWKVQDFDLQIIRAYAIMLPYESSYIAHVSHRSNSHKCIYSAITAAALTRERQ